jgi:hypothetical protein
MPMTSPLLHHGYFKSGIRWKKLMSLPLAKKGSRCVKAIAVSPRPYCTLGLSPAPLLPQPWRLVCAHSNYFAMPASDAPTLPFNRSSRAFATCMVSHFALTLPSNFPSASTFTSPFARKSTAESRWPSGERQLIGGFSMHALLVPIHSKMNQNWSLRCYFVWMEIIQRNGFHDELREFRGLKTTTSHWGSTTNAQIHGSLRGIITFLGRGWTVGARRLFISCSWSLALRCVSSLKVCCTGPTLTGNTGCKWR